MSVIEREEVEVLAEPFDVLVDPVSQILWDAADLIERDGWVKFSYFEPGRGYCILGAITSVAPPSASKAQAYRRIYREVGMDPVSWNDRRATSKEQVVRALREAAEGD